MLGKINTGTKTIFSFVVQSAVALISLSLPAGAAEDGAPSSELLQRNLDGVQIESFDFSGMKEAEDKKIEVQVGEFIINSSSKSAFTIETPGKIRTVILPKTAIWLEVTDQVTTVRNLLVGGEARQLINGNYLDLKYWEESICGSSEKAVIARLFSSPLERSELRKINAPGGTFILRCKGISLNSLARTDHLMQSILDSDKSDKEFANRYLRNADAQVKLKWVFRLLTPAEIQPYRQSNKN